MGQALTHSSYSNELAAFDSASDVQNNERLEFLGDAVIGLVVAHELMELFPSSSEGNLSRWRSTLVSRRMLAEIAVECGLGAMVLLGRGERQTGGTQKSSILAAVLEAIVGALYLDGGLDVARAFLRRIYEAPMKAVVEQGERAIDRVDKKTLLQENIQRLHRTTPIYRLVDSWGAEHEKHFRVEIVIAGKAVATGEGRSKKDAEQSAAAAALDNLGL